MAKYTKRADGRYCTHVDLGYNDCGKRIRKTLYGKTIKELDEKVFQIKIDRNSGIIKNKDTNFYTYATC